MDTVSIREREVDGTDGRVFALQIRPYKSLDNRIDGAVVVLFDVSSVQDQAAALEVASATGEALISTMREPILLLDSDLKVQKANRAFLAAFQVRQAETEGRLVLLGDGQLKSGARRLLERCARQRTRSFRSSTSSRHWRRDAVDAPGSRPAAQPGVILLIVRDVTDDGP